MFGVVQGGIGGTGGIAAPFGNPSSQPSVSIAPKNKSSSSRHNKNKHHSTLTFRDDTRLVALRYDQTVALEPPIPLPPPRSPLRPPPRASSLNLAASPAAHSPVIVPPRRPPPPTEQHPALRTISSPRNLDHDTRRDSVLASTASSRSYGSYGSYANAYYEVDSSDEDEDDDPFAYDRIDAVTRVQPLQLRAESAGSSIYSFQGHLDLDQKRGHVTQGQGQGQEQSQSQSARQREGERERRRVSEADSSRPSEASLSPTLSIGSSTTSPAFPASPATPPPHFSKRFVRSFSLRSGSYNKSASLSSSSSSSASASASMKRLRKKSLATEDGKSDGSGNGSAIAGSEKVKVKAKIATATGTNGSGNGSGNGNGNRRVEMERGMDGPGMGTDMVMELPDMSVPYSPSSLLASSSTSTTYSASTPSPLPLSSQSHSHSHSWRATNPIHPTNTPNPNPNHMPPTHGTRTNGSGNVGPASPTISTNIPSGSFFEEDDLSKLSFSIRGSLIFGGKRPWKTSGSTSSANLKMADKDVIPEQSTIHNSNNTANPIIDNTNNNNTKTRVFPLVPSASKREKGHGSHAPTSAPAPARPPREDDMGVAALIQKPFQLPESPHLLQRSQSELVHDNTSSSHKLPPSIRVISAEAEKESQKVRSLYESGEVLQLGDGEVIWSRGQALEPPPEAPSDADGNDAASDQKPGLPIQTSATTSSPVPQDKHQLAGGIEDWEGVQGEDVDRYGFIVAHQPDSSSPPSSATSPGSSPIRFSSRKNRNVLIRKDVTSLSLGAKRGPTKKLSARSLNTHTSELSALSRRSVRSTIRQATNKLPHNKDRRIVDEAGDLLALQPGLSFIAEDEGIEKIAAELKRKEVKRTEKWRKMAKMVKPGSSEGQGTIFHFDTKNPKLIERTWKGIPDCWRSAAWYSFLASSAKADQVNYVPDEELTAAFRRLVDEPSPDDLQIDLDVPRTINQHIMFRRRYRGGQRLLFRVLHCLSLYFPDTGYVQGMATLAATLLSYYDEEQCFIMLVRLWLFRGLNRIYQSGFVELIGALKDFETHWLNDKDVAEVLTELCIDPTAYATRWYLTLFNLSIPFPVQLRVWDVFMLLGSSPPEQLEGSPGTGKEVDTQPSSKGLEILHATSLAIIDTLHATLIDSDFENAMKSLTSWVPIKDEQRFLEVVHVEWKKHHNKQKKKA
ncbi:rab-GTPase-TBC domain-containing protein [Nemania sp. FL0031]|nr:rab-GTPase-TBC domain-containing protein [Nemania sp. FL0031]